MPTFYIVLEENMPGVNGIGLEGRALSKQNAKLEEIAQRLGVRSLMSFFSANQEEAISLLGKEEAESLSVPIPREEWFSAKEGLTTVSALLKAIAAEPSLENSKLTQELTDFQYVLEAAQSQNARWHLAVDY